jgi:hypothetical protein
MSEGSRDGRFVCEIGVSMAVERLLRSGYQVAMPIIDDGYDLLAIDGRRIWRIQVKATSTSGPNRRRIRIRRGRYHAGHYGPEHIDAFIAVHTETGEVMCVPVQEVQGRSWINFTQHSKYSDFEILRRLKPCRN